MFASRVGLASAIVLLLLACGAPAAYICDGCDLPNDYNDCPSGCLDCVKARVHCLCEEESVGGCQDHCPEAYTKRNVDWGSWVLGGCSIDVCERWGNRNTGECNQCDAGRYRKSVGVGFADYDTVWHEHHHQCDGCVRGRYQPGPNADSSCKLCPAGKYQDEYGKSNCKDCPVGMYSAEEGYAACINCANGRAQALRGQTTCVECEAGRHTETERAALCSGCLPGTYSKPDATGCLDCPKGKTSENRATECTFCDPGTYAQRTRSVRCQACEAGRYMPTSGASTCFDCDRGKFSAAQAKSSCVTAPCNSNCESGAHVGYTSSIRGIGCALKSMYDEPVSAYDKKCMNGKPAIQDGCFVICSPDWHDDMPLDFHGRTSFGSATIPPTFQPTAAPTPPTKAPTRPTNRPTTRPTRAPTPWTRGDWEITLPAGFGPRGLLFNFGPPNAERPSPRYVGAESIDAWDHGLEYQPQGNLEYGWSCDQSKPNDNTRWRNEWTLGFTNPFWGTVITPDRSETCALTTWDLKVDNGDYDVEVFYCENWDGFTGSRTSGCKIESKSASVGAAPACKSVQDATIWSDRVTVSDGKLTFSGEWGPNGGCDAITAIRVTNAAPAPVRAPVTNWCRSDSRQYVFPLSVTAEPKCLGSLGLVLNALDADCGQWADSKWAPGWFGTDDNVFCPKHFEFHPMYQSCIRQYSIYACLDWQTAPSSTCDPSQFYFPDGTKWPNSAQGRPEGGVKDGGGHIISSYLNGDDATPFWMTNPVSGNFARNHGCGLHPVEVALTSEMLEPGCLDFKLADKVDFAGRHFKDRSFVSLQSAEAELLNYVPSYNFTPGYTDACPLTVAPTPAPTKVPTTPAPTYMTLESHEEFVFAFG